MIKQKKLVIVASIIAIYLLVTAALSRGDTNIIESNKPLQDIVVMCDWASALGTLHGGGHSVMQRKALVVESGKPYNCGINWTAGLTLSILSSSMAKHPTHTFAYVNTREDGVIVRKAISKLKILDEQRAKLEAGYWDKHRNPIAEYARSFGLCGFGDRYIEYYSQVNIVNKNYFYNKYNEFLSECNKRIYEEVMKYDSVIAERSFNLENTMQRIWESERWEKYVRQLIPARPE